MSTTPPAAPYGTPEGRYEPYRPTSGPGTEGTADAYAGPGEVTGQVAPPSSNARVLGWLGVAVLYGLALWQLVVPSVRTFLMSMRQGNVFSGDGEWVGLANWADVAPQLFPGLGITMLIALPVTVASMVLGLAIGSGMTAQHRHAVPVRVLVGLLGALFVPLGIVMSRYMSEGIGGDPVPTLFNQVVTLTLATLPLLTAGFATAFAAVLSSRSPGRGVMVVLVAGLTGALALGPQLFDQFMALVQLGPPEAQAPMLLVYQHGLQRFDLGAGSAVASILLLGAGVLGVVAMLVLLLAKVRLAPPPEVPNPSPTRSGPLGLVVGAVALLGALILVGPFLIGSLGSGSIEGIDAVSVGLNTWLPAAVGTLVQVVVAVLGGAAIGWCRPAGRHSLWLLLPLAPWLFVGPAPLILINFVDASNADTLDTWIASVPGPGVVVAAVVVLALMFARLPARGGRRARRAVLAASAGIGGVLLLVQAQSLLPSLVMIVSPELRSAPVTAMIELFRFRLAVEDIDMLVGLLYPIPMFLLVAALGVLAQLGTRGVALERDDPPPGWTTG